MYISNGLLPMTQQQKRKGVIYERVLTLNNVIEFHPKGSAISKQQPIFVVIDGSRKPSGLVAKPTPGSAYPQLKNRPPRRPVPSTRDACPAHSAWPPLGRFGTKEMRDALSYRVPSRITHCRKYGRRDIYPICPRCDMSIDREYQLYCDRCGQKLDWSSYPMCPTW